MRIIHLQARHPVMNAARNPNIMAETGREVTASVVPASMIFSTSRNASPKMGISTIRKENLATASFLLPNSSPVAMVLPEREIPGNTATACANPMTKASHQPIFSFWRGLAK